MLLENFEITKIDADSGLFQELEESWLREMILFNPNFVELMDFHYLPKVDSTVHWIIKIDGEAIGLCTFNDCPKHKSAEILKLYIKEGFRFKGYGLALLEAIEQYAIKMKYGRVLTNLANFYEGVDILLQDIGYQIIPMDESKPPSDAVVVMEKIV